MKKSQDYFTISQWAELNKSEHWYTYRCTVSVRKIPVNPFQNNSHITSPTVYGPQIHRVHNEHKPVGSAWGVLTPGSTGWILQDKMNVWLFYFITCHWKGRGRWWPNKGILVMQEMAGKRENWIRGEMCRPVMCWDRTSVKSGLKLPPSNTSHPSVAMRPAITGALPPTVHLFPGMSRDASTNSLNRVSLSIKRLQGTEMWKRSVDAEDEPSENHLHSSSLFVTLFCLKNQINLVHRNESCYQK